MFTLTDPASIDDLRTLLADHDRRGAHARNEVVAAANRLRTAIEPSLFDPLSDPTADLPGRSHGRATELAAAYAITPKSGTTRAAVLAAIASASRDGRTDQELEDQLHMHRPTPGNRRGELVRGGWVRDSGERRLTHAGNPAVVWVLTEEGQARLNLRVAA